MNIELRWISKEADKVSFKAFTYLAHLWCLYVLTTCHRRLIPSAVHTVRLIIEVLAFSH
jgi:hypothetical protein